MAQTLPPQPPRSLPLRDSPALASPRSRSSVSASVSPPPTSRSSSSPRIAPRQPSRRITSDSKENVVPEMDESVIRTRSKAKSGDLSEEAQNHKELGNGGGRTWRDGSVEVEEGDTIRRRSATTPQRSVRSSKSPVPASSPYNGLPTLPTVFDEPDSPTSQSDSSRPPPPAASTLTGQGRPVTRKRRSSSIKRKPSPGVTPTKAVDWEIPRKSLHSSIGFVTLFLRYLDPPTLRPLLTVLITMLISVATSDALRLNIPAFAEIWEAYLGFLMRESERKQINGVVWYLIGVIFVLGLYPRDVAVVSILTLSWSDTTASTIGRLWGKYTTPLPPHFPGIKYLPFAPRKSLAGFLAATVTGISICLGFWWNGSGGRWHILDGHWAGLLITSIVVGVGGAVVEALDLGLDDNLTLPILSGAIIWSWLSVTNLVF